MSYAEDEGLDAFDPPEGGERESEWKNGEHTTREGNTLKLSEMSEDHLENTVKYIDGLDTSPLLNELSKRRQEKIMKREDNEIGIGMNPTPTQEQREAAEEAIGRFFSCETHTECGCTECTTHTYTLRDADGYDDILKSVASLLASREARAYAKGHGVLLHEIDAGLAKAASEAAEAVYLAVETEATGDLSLMSNERHMLDAARQAADRYKT